MGIWNIYPHVNVYIDTEKPPRMQIMFRTTATMGGNHSSKDCLRPPQKIGMELPQILWGNEFPLVQLGTVNHGISIISVYIYICIIIYISHMRFSSTTLPQDQVVSVTITFGSLIPHFQVPFWSSLASDEKMPYYHTNQISTVQGPSKYHIVGYLYIYTYI